MRKYAIATITVNLIRALRSRAARQPCLDNFSAVRSGTRPVSTVPRARCPPVSLVDQTINEAKIRQLEVEFADSYIDLTGDRSGSRTSGLSTA